jgi:hypothetical protein
MTELAWPVPEINDMTLAFPAYALDWMPEYDAIPDEFKDRHSREAEWIQIANYWFANGLNDKVEFYAREGVDAKAAFRALQATLGSYQPKHEHKIAAVAYMMSCWFSSVKKWKHS